MFEWIKRLVSDAFSPASKTPKSDRRRVRPQLEVLEDRIAPAGNVVDTKADDGSAGSLRQVIANAAPGSTITFDPKVFQAGNNYTIFLDADLGPISIATNNLTIDGGNANISIDGLSSVRLFNILGGNLSETIKNLTLEDGKPSANDPNGFDGGAILDTSQGPLNLSGDQFENNSASGPGGASGSGGAVAAYLGNNALTVNNCNFGGNTALRYGGAIATKGDGENLKITKSDFAGNTATLFDGGAVYSTNTTSITTSTFEETNTAGLNGGALAFEPDDSSSLTLTYSTIADNTAANGAGGGVYVSYGGAETYTETFNGDLFNGNQANGSNGEGGGLAVNQSSSQTGSATLNLFNSTFFDNSANGYGGGLYLYAASDATSKNVLNLTSLTVYQNSASTQGGGLDIDPQSTFGANNKVQATQLSNSIIAGNVVENTSADGPDIYGQIFSNSCNLVGIGDGASVMSNGGKWYLSDIVGTSADPKDPKLDPNGLQNNGGPTLTIKPVAGSPALGNGNNRLPIQIDGTQLDQRGYKRQSIGAIKVTIGAYDPNAQVVKVGQSSTSIDSSVNPALAGQSVTFTAEVTTGAGTPTGDVSFQEGDTTLATVPLDDNGFASFTTSFPDLGSYPITATYSGDDDSAGSSASLTQVISTENVSSLYLYSSNNPALVNQPVTLTASVSGNYGTPTGTVTFLAGDTPIGTASVDGYGDATLTTSALPLGDSVITANYSGDATYNSSTTTLTQTVQQAPVSMYLSSSVNPSLVNQPLTLNVNVSGDYGTPTGSVTFLSGNTVIGTATVDGNGNATLTTSALPLGNQTLSAVYSGDATYGSNTSTMNQTVQQGTAYLYLSSNNSSSQAGQTVTFNANVSSEGNSTSPPTGSVIFYDGSTPLGTVNIDDGGNASLSISTLAIGDHNISAVYSGDATFGATSGSMTQTVNANSAYMWLYSSNESSQAGAAVTFTANLNGGNYGTPTGSVNFYDGSTFLGSGTLDGNGNATFTTSSLSVGSHSITAEYDGDSLFGSSSGSMTQTVS